MTELKYFLVSYMYQTKQTMAKFTIGSRLEMINFCFQHGYIILFLMELTEEEGTTNAFEMGSEVYVENVR